MKLPQLKAPPVDEAFVTYLDKAYPERSPSPEDTEREIWMKAGERRLVRRLLHALEQQKKADVSV